MTGGWIVITEGPVPLRCWWNNPVQTTNHFALILPEVFGVNSWVRSVVDRLTDRGTPSLAIPLFARTAPELDLGYSDHDLIEGRRHKEAATTDQILTDASLVIQ